DEPFKKAMAAAVRLLGARDHGAHELKQKLKARKFGADAIAHVLEECRRLGYIDDVRCCERYYDELTAKGYGSRRVRSTMRDKGFAEDVIDEIFSLSREETDELENALRALQKKMTTFKRVADPRKRREKMYRFLHSRGFPPDVVSDAIRDSGLVYIDDFYEAF
ncbi:MAG: regulatory protein RecX, partial [Desulfobacterales bacterium]|nr:regulatory protein RecX [Desulfobacterales bacterium]